MPNYDRLQSEVKVVFRSRLFRSNEQETYELVSQREAFRQAVVKKREDGIGWYSVDVIGGGSVHGTIYFKNRQVLFVKGEVAQLDPRNAQALTEEADHE